MKSNISVGLPHRPALVPARQPARRACSSASARAIPTSPCCARAGAAACAASSRRCPIPIGSSDASRPGKRRWTADGTPIAADEQAIGCVHITSHHGRKAPVTRRAIGGDRRPSAVIRRAFTSSRDSHASDDQGRAPPPDPLHLRPPGRAVAARGAAAARRRTAARRSRATRSQVKPGEAFPQLAAGSRTATGSRALVFPEKSRELEVTVDLVADMTVINPFDFFVDAVRRALPLRLHAGERARARALPRGRAARRRGWRRGSTRARASFLGKPITTIDFLVAREPRCCSSDVNYLIRMEPGIQTPEETLERARARAAIRRGCWCRSCATSASPRASPRATSSSSSPT